MVCYSGYGIITGYTENDQKLTTHLLPDYYGKVGKSEGRFGGSLLPQEIAWDFSRFTPELIVINLGTNDDSYTKDDPAKQADYAENYVAFLQKKSGVIIPIRPYYVRSGSWGGQAVSCPGADGGPLCPGNRRQQNLGDEIRGAARRGRLRR
ncbi:SGNH/GDSL hydrolase family protein [Paenibacillus rhizoplanae]